MKISAFSSRHHRSHLCSSHSQSRSELSFAASRLFVFAMAATRNEEEDTSREAEVGEGLPRDEMPPLVDSEDSDTPPPDNWSSTDSGDDSDKKEGPMSAPPRQAKKTSRVVR